MRLPQTERLSTPICDFGRFFLGFAPNPTRPLRGDPNTPLRARWARLCEPSSSRPAEG